MLYRNVRFDSFDVNVILSASEESPLGLGLFAFPLGYTPCRNHLRGRGQPCDIAEECSCCYSLVGLESPSDSRNLQHHSSSAAYELQTAITRQSRPKSPLSHSFPISFHAGTVPDNSYEPSYPFCGCCSVSVYYFAKAASVGL